MSHVDLNPIRAGVTQKLEESEYTSIKKRLESMTEQQLNSAVTAIAGEVRSRTMVIPLKDYIELVEWTGKAIIYPNKASIPAHLASVFERLNIDQKNWLNQVQAYDSNYYRAVGCFEKLREQTLAIKQNWLKGINAVRELYLTPE